MKEDDSLERAQRGVRKLAGLATPKKKDKTTGRSGRRNSPKVRVPSSQEEYKKSLRGTRPPPRRRGRKKSGNIWAGI